MGVPVAYTIDPNMRSSVEGTDDLVSPKLAAYTSCGHWIDLYMEHG